MAPMSTTADARDHLDPWGFGRCGTDDRTATVEYLDPLDEFVDDADLPTLVSLPGAASPLAQSARLGAPTLPTPGAAMPFAMPAALAGASRAAAAIRLPFSRDRIGVLALFAAVIVAQAFYIGFSLTGEAAPRVGVGDLVLSSHPSGVQVKVDGRLHGTTPLVLPLDAGTHALELVGPDGTPAALDVAIVAGQRVTRHVALAAAPASTRVGTLKVDTAGTAARVLVDDALVGAAPASRADLLPGTHTVTVEFARGGRLTRTVTVAPGETVALVVPAPAQAAVPAAPAMGALHVDAPFEVQVFEGDRLVGASTSPRLALATGTHTLTLVNTDLGFSQTTRTTIAAGKTLSLVADVPAVPVQLNALPWAEVLVDGRALGETPLANVPLALGTHRVVFRHPDLGDRVETLTVRAGAPVRLAADLRRTR